MSRENLLMVADSEHDANMLYAVGFFVPDPFIYLRLRGKCLIVLSDLEIDRARKLAPHCRVLSLTHYYKKLRDVGIRSPGYADVIRLILREHRLRRIQVPENFPFGLACELQDFGIRLELRHGSFFARRETKSPEEVKKISAALMMAEVGLSEGIQALKSAKVGKRSALMYRNLPLTSERLRAIIDTAIIQAGGCPRNTIVAGGNQACDPHESGSGPLKANQPIIIDVFPRSQKTGFFGDITRTLIKGRASESVRKMYQTVARAQEVAFSMIEDGKPGKEVHETLQKVFEQEGYKTGKHNGRMQGFFHGTGHGLGLELHERPRISALSDEILKNGHVVTVEPGLYYPGMGAVRLEDVVWVTGNGNCNLTKFEKVLEV
jgi:Xaa-Pro aminopeptidase